MDQNESLFNMYEYAVDNYLLPNEVFDLKKSMAGGFRKLVPSYDGPLVRVKRGSDDGEKSFWPEEDGSIDRKVLEEWAGKGGYEVIHFYNQVEKKEDEKKEGEEVDESVDHPNHYNQIPGVECIDVVEHFNFNRGNAIKYIWRADLKDTVVENLRKAIWYLEREIDRIELEIEIENG